jgi:hypothetical protein
VGYFRADYLNVLQGRNRDEARAWREAVKDFNDNRIFGDAALDGIAFAGATRLHLSMTLEHLVVFRDSGLLREDARFHVLGTGHPDVGCALTVVLDGLRETLGPGVNLTFDSSSPFLLAGRYKKAYVDTASGSRRINLRAKKMPDDAQHVGSSTPWPCSSPIGDQLTLGDLNIKRGVRTCWDQLSFALLAAHNVWMLSHSIALINRRLRLPEADRRRWLPKYLFNLTHKIREVLRSETPMTLIERWADDLDQLADRARDSKLLPEDSDR